MDPACQVLLPSPTAHQPALHVSQHLRTRGDERRMELEGGTVVLRTLLGSRRGPQSYPSSCRAQLCPGWSDVTQTAAGLPAGSGPDHMHRRVCETQFSFLEKLPCAFQDLSPQAGQSPGLQILDGFGPAMFLVSHLGSIPARLHPKSVFPFPHTGLAGNHRAWCLCADLGTLGRAGQTVGDKRVCCHCSEQSRR